MELTMFLVEIEEQMVKVETETENRIEIEVKQKQLPMNVKRRKASSVLLTARRSTPAKTMLRSFVHDLNDPSTSVSSFHSFKAKVGARSRDAIPSTIATRRLSSTAKGCDLAKMRARLESEMRFPDPSSALKMFLLSWNLNQRLKTESR